MLTKHLKTSKIEEFKALKALTGGHLRHLLQIVAINRYKTCVPLFCTKAEVFKSTKRMVKS